jgi:regulator of cell morphogenesis and NO signaling
MMISERTTVGEVVAGDFRTAAVFRRYGIDYCCGGRSSLADACRRAHVQPALVLGELLAVEGAIPASERYDSWSPAFLADYIVNNHHSYVRRVLPELVFLADKVARVHGAHCAELIEMNELVHTLDKEMMAHMMKEEDILFPYIKAVEDSEKSGAQKASAPFGRVANPIACMIEEHESAGGILHRLEEMTDGFQPPADACTSWRIYYRFLSEFQDDLHKHVHLENNVLFPKALQMDAL